MNALQTGCFGECPDKVEEYKKRCHVLFPYCLLFMPVKHGDIVENGPSSEKTACNGSNGETKSWSKPYQWQSVTSYPAVTATKHHTVNPHYSQC